MLCYTKTCLSYVLVLCALYGLGGLGCSASVITRNQDQMSNSASHNHHEITLNQDALITGEEETVLNRQKRQEEERLLNFNDFISTVKNNPILDLVVVADRSWGMGRRDFYLQIKKLIRSLINQYFVLHPNYVHLSVVTFAKTIEVPIDHITPASGLFQTGTQPTKAELFSSSDSPWEQVLYKVDPEISKVFNQAM